MPRSEYWIQAAEDRKRLAAVAPVYDVFYYDDKGTLHCSSYGVKGISYNETQMLQVLDYYSYQGVEAFAVQTGTVAGRDIDPALCKPVKSLSNKKVRQ